MPLVLERFMVKNLKQVMTVLLDLPEEESFSDVGLPGVVVESALPVMDPATDEMLKRLGRRLRDFFSGAAAVGLGTERLFERCATGERSCSSGR